MTETTPQAKPKRKYNTAETSARRARTLNVQQLPKDVIQIINENRKLTEDWKQAVIRLLKTYKRKRTFL